MNKLVAGICGGILAAGSIQASAGCADLSTATSWRQIDTHKILLYRGSTAIALLNIPYCFVYPGTDVQKINDYVCSWDKILVDREVCDIQSVETL